MQHEILPYEAHPSSVRRRRSSSSRALRRLALPITAAVLLAMIGIPFLSLEMVGNSQSRTAVAEVRLTDLENLPRTQQSELESLRDWLKEHFADDEIEAMRDRFVAGRDPATVRAELQDLAKSVSRGRMVDIPSYYTDRVKGRIGERQTENLRRHLKRMRPSSGELRSLAIEEVFPGKLR